MTRSELKKIIADGETVHLECKLAKNAIPANFCFADISWSEAGKIQTTNVTTLAGHPLSSASLTSLPKAGYQLHYYDTLTQFSENSGLLICEAKSRYASMRLDIKVGDTLLYSYSVPMTILPVKEMYNWYNFRHLSGENRARNSEYHTLWEEDYAKALIFLHGANVAEADARLTRRENWYRQIIRLYTRSTFAASRRYPNP